MEIEFEFNEDGLRELLEGYMKGTARALEEVADSHSGRPPEEIVAELERRGLTVDPDHAVILAIAEGRALSTEIQLDL